MCCLRQLKGVNFLDFLNHISNGGNGAYTSLLKEKPRNILLYADLLLNLLNFSKRNLEICGSRKIIPSKSVLSCVAFHVLWLGCGGNCILSLIFSSACAT